MKESSPPSSTSFDPVQLLKELRGGDAWIDESGSSGRGSRGSSGSGMGDRRGESRSGSGGIGGGSRGSSGMGDSRRRRTSGSFESMESGRMRESPGTHRGNLPPPPFLASLPQFHYFKLGKEEGKELSHFLLCLFQQVKIVEMVGWEKVGEGG